MKKIAFISILTFVMMTTLSWLQQPDSTDSLAFATMAEDSPDADGAQDEEHADFEEGGREPDDNQSEESNQATRTCESRANTAEQTISVQNERINGLKELIDSFVDEVVMVKGRLDAEVDGYGESLDEVEAQSELLTDQLQKVDELPYSINCDSLEPFAHVHDYVSEYRQAISYLHEYRLKAVELALIVYDEWIQIELKKEDDSQHNANSQEGLEDEG